MKEISEENQWRIFELLEGNLSPEDQLKLHNEIDKQPELKDFYQSLKHTYLTPEKIEFTNKNRLLKSKNGVIINFRSYLKYAAAAAVIGVTVYIQFFKIEPSTTIKSAVVHTQPIQQRNTNITQNINDQKTPIKFAKYLPKYNNHTLVNNNNIKPLKTFNTKEFKPSVKLIDENQFLNQLLENGYLSTTEKKDMMLKWLLLNSNNQPEFGHSNENGKNIVPVEVKVVTQDILSPEEMENLELNEIWVKEAKQMLKKGKIPKMKLVSTKKEHQWMPKFELEIQTESASLVKNILE